MGDWRCQHWYYGGDITEDIKSLVDYYKNLLIIQYSGKPKAQATIELFAETLMASGVYFAVRDAYSVDTAVGVQLDIIGKYVGIDRFFNVTDPEGFFRTPDYAEVDPELEPAGFADYADFDTGDSFNGTMTYDSIVTVANRLNDDDYRILIKLKIIQNHSNHSHASIDESMFRFFGMSVVPSSSGGMNMYYFITSDVTPIILAARIKEVLPRPMGVGAGFIQTGTSGKIFGYTSYFDLQNGITDSIT